jgi:hypothetical protein
MMSREIISISEMANAMVQKVENSTIGGAKRRRPPGVAARRFF